MLSRKDIQMVLKFEQTYGSREEACFGQLLGRRDLYSDSLQRDLLLYEKAPCGDEKSVDITDEILKILNPEE